MKKFVSAFMSLIMLFVLTAPTFAAEPDSTAIADSSTATTETQLQVMPRNAQSFNLQNVGDTYILMENEDGVLRIELLDKYETISNVSQAGTTETETSRYGVFYENWLGVSKLVVEITATATWINNGANSYIQNLNGKYTVYDNSFSCEWDYDYNYASDYVHYLMLNIYHGLSLNSYLLSAILAVVGDVPSIYVEIGPI